MALHDFDELVRAVIAQIMANDLASEIGGLRPVERGNDVPGRPAPGHVIERRKGAGNMKRFVIGGGIGDTDAERPCRIAQGGGADHGIQLYRADALAERGRGVRLVNIGYGKAIVKEGEVKLPFFENLADAAVITGRQKIEFGLRVTPGRRKVCTILGLKKGDEGHFLARGHLDYPHD